MSLGVLSWSPWVGRSCIWTREWEGLIFGYMGTRLEPAVIRVGLAPGSSWASLHGRSTGIRDHKCGLNTWDPGRKSDPGTGQELGFPGAGLVVESMGPSGSGADQESGFMGVGLAGAWLLAWLGFSGEPGTGSIWKVGFVGTHLESGFAGAHWKPGATGTAWAMSAGQCWDVPGAWV